MRQLTFYWQISWHYSMKQFHCRVHASHCNTGNWLAQIPFCYMISANVSKHHIFQTYSSIQECSEKSKLVSHWATHQHMYCTKVITYGPVAVYGSYQDSATYATCVDQRRILLALKRLRFCVYPMGNKIQLNQSLTAENTYRNVWFTHGSVSVWWQ